MLQDIAPDILVTVAITSFVQSLFGVGVLLFGTPLLLLQGYDFVDAVYVLLPVSLLINMFQIFKDYRELDLDFCRKIIVYAIPFVVLSSLLVRSVSMDLGLVVGLLLLLIAAKDWLQIAGRLVDGLLRYEKAYFAVMGCVHGLTNLGGPLLTAAVHNKGYDKRVTRVTVASAYAMFAAFQIATLLGSGYKPDTSFLAAGVYVATGLAVFLVTETAFYADIKSDTYRKLFAVFLVLAGLSLCVKSL
jgi:hypothetical protein